MSLELAIVGILFTFAVKVVGDIYFQAKRNGLDTDRYLMLLERITAIEKEIQKLQLQIQALKSNDDDDDDSNGNSNSYNNN